MDATYSTLVEFLLARYDEAASVAKAATGGGWLVDGAAVIAPGIPGETHDCELASDVSEADAEFIAANNPAAVLADIAVKRRIIAELGPPYFIAGGSSAPYEAVVRLLAEPFAEHPDYQRWRWGVDEVGPEGVAW